ncbi:DNA/RNA non-specific endonuclease [Aeromonas sp. MrichA-1]|uniref:DNA/RNA non-specific endonuclease n=1 Tax=Aeromonas sp. MrichA-1 TaxID=2823362 RepID=UPI001B32FC11|nr:DNA/RNA non-specific endonuclease [Aeromonas sp. MrichA-1]MBP4081756.1 DNA/RNA non-specific endonuclease [Aeromonas sp. MrichA-1]
MKKSILLAAGLLLSSSMAFATDCPQFYLGGHAPKINVPIEMNKEICYSRYSIGYNYRSKSALYAAQTLTKKNVLEARSLDRFDSFHDDPNIPSQYRVDENDYRGSMLDRGHLAPNKDFGDPQSQYESFSMANMVPQLHKHNAGIWLGIETAVRGMAMKYGRIQVVTGGIYSGTTRKLRGGVPVPNAMYKAVYVENANRNGAIAAAYVSNNDASGTYEIVSINQLTQMIGMDVFPSGQANVKSIAGNVYKPQNRRNNSQGNSADVMGAIGEIGTNYIKHALIKHIN